MAKTYKPHQRNPYIKKAFTDELDLKTKTVPSKAQYKRRPKHKNLGFSEDWSKDHVSLLIRNSYQ